MSVNWKLDEAKTWLVTWWGQEVREHEGPSLMASPWWLRPDGFVPMAPWLCPNGFVLVACLAGFVVPMSLSQCLCPNGFVPMEVFPIVCPDGFVVPMSLSWWLCLMVSIWWLCPGGFCPNGFVPLASCCWLCPDGFVQMQHNAAMHHPPINM